MTQATFTKGLHELGDGLFAYLQPRGQWGYSNAGLVSGQRSSLLIDTLMDLTLTRKMLEQMRPITTTSPIRSLVNTHANGDHCFGNELVPDRATIYATVAAAEEMLEVPPATLRGLMAFPDPEIAAFANHAFGDFDFDGVTGRQPDHTFDGQLILAIDDREVIIRDLGPAHTRSDSVAYVPSARTVFTGDLVFVGGTPIAWQGPISNWTSACAAILELDIDAVVPGHGPITDKQGVRDVSRYLEFVKREAKQRYDAGIDALTAAFDIELGEFAELEDPERIVVTVETAYRDLDPTRPAANILGLFRQMGRYRKQKLGRLRDPG